MKKSKLLRQVIFFHFNLLMLSGNVFAQADTLYYDRTIITLQLGVNHGFEVLDLKNAGISTAIPMGVNFKTYGSSHGWLLKNPLKFLQEGISWVPMLVERNFTSYLRLDIKYGFVMPRSFTVFSIGPNYSFNLYGSFGNMYGGEITVQQSNIPISFIFTHNDTLGINYFMIGISLQMARLRLRRGAPYGY